MQKTTLRKKSPVSVHRFIRKTENSLLKTIKKSYKLLTLLLGIVAIGLRVTEELLDRKQG